MTIKIERKLFTRFLKLNAEKAAIQKELNELKDSFGLPEPSKKHDGIHLITDKNGDTMGKFTIFWRDPEKVIRPGFWTGRLS